MAKQAERVGRMEGVYFETAVTPEMRLVNSGNEASRILNNNLAQARASAPQMGEPITTVSVGGVLHELSVREDGIYLISPHGEEYYMGEKTTPEAFKKSLRNLRKDITRATGED